VKLPGERKRERERKAMGFVTFPQVFLHNHISPHYSTDTFPSYLWCTLVFVTLCFHDLSFYLRLASDDGTRTWRSEDRTFKGACASPISFDCMQQHGRQKERDPPLSLSLSPPPPHTHTHPHTHRKYCAMKHNCITSPPSPALCTLRLYVNPLVSVSYSMAALFSSFSIHPSL
jgi:hypothetical protein